MNSTNIVLNIFIAISQIATNFLPICINYAIEQEWEKTNVFS